MTDTPTDTITRACMDQLIATGHAYPWTQPLGGVVPVIARNDGAWWVVLDTDDPHGDRDGSGDGEHGRGEWMYRRAPQQLADTLDRVSAVLDLADAAVAAADHAARPGALSGGVPGTGRHRNR